MNYQTDFSGYIKKGGCLLFSLFRIAELESGWVLSRSIILDLMDELHLKIRASYNKLLPAISDENDVNKMGVFVHDHEAVLNRALKQLSCKIRFKYTGRLYVPDEEIKGYKSFGKFGGDYVVYQIQTPYSGHFRLANYDPYQPETEFVRLKSLRFYTRK